MNVCAMMVGAGEAHRYLDRMLRYASSWADLICVYADAPDPDTEAALRAGTGCEVALRVERDSVYESGGEGAARNRMFELLDDVLEPGTIVVNLDADEQLIDADATLDAMHAELRAAASRAESGAVCWRARYRHLWSRAGDRVRVDGLWDPDVREAAWCHRRGGRTEAGAMFSESTPAIARVGPHGAVELEIHHWGYTHLEDRFEKHELYMRRDGGRQHDAAHLRSITDTMPALEAVGRTDKKSNCVGVG